VVRAAAADRDMANAVGINVPLVYTGVCALGTALAGHHGVFHGPMRYPPGRRSGLRRRGLRVVVIGGLAVCPGPCLARYWWDARRLWHSHHPAVSMAFIYMVMAAVLVFRPQGLFGMRETRV